MGRPLTTQLDDPDRRPYFLWDEDTSIAQLRAVLRGPSGAERDRLLGKMLREARDIDVWTFVSPADVAVQRSSSYSPSVMDSGSGARPT